MRKDYGDRKKINGLLYETFTFNGLNQDRFLNALAKVGVPLFDIKKKSNRKMRFTVPLSQSEKVFAISREMCYNKNALKKTRESGVAAPLFFMLTHVGLLLGAAFFIMSCFFADDFVLERTLTGSGGAYERDIIKYLDENGAAVNSRFSEIDLKSLEKGIYSLGKFSFVSCEKRGNVLFVDTELAEKRSDVLRGDAKSLVSDCDGIVEDLKVYRGTATVKIKDAVRAGDVLVEGFATVKDVRTEVNVIACAVIRYESVFTCLLNTDGEDGRAVALAEEYCGGEISDVRIIKEKTGDGFLYSVIFSRKRIIYTG